MEGRVRFDGAHPLFADHFPGAPVVPGTLVARFFCAACAALAPEQRVTGLKRFRFRHFVAPGEYAWSIRLEEGAARCALRDAEGTLLASGRLLLEREETP